MKWGDIPGLALKLHQKEDSMNFLDAYLACAAGVLLSALIPSLAAIVRQHFTAGTPAAFEQLALAKLLWHATRPYVVLALLSLAVSLLIIAFLGKQLATWQSALIAGYLWDSTLQKIAKT